MMIVPATQSSSFNDLDFKMQQLYVGCHFVQFSVEFAG
jgi:hypothetical protein